MFSTWINNVCQTIAQCDDSYTKEEVLNLITTDCVYIDVDISNNTVQMLLDKEQARIRIEGEVVTLYSTTNTGEFVRICTDEDGIDNWIYGQE